MYDDTITFTMGDSRLDLLLETCFAIDSSFDWAVGFAYFREANRILSGPSASGAIVDDSEIDSSISFLDPDLLEDLLVGHHVDQSPTGAHPCCCYSLPTSKNTNFRRPNTKWGVCSWLDGVVVA
jgi:hypothetical protein